MRRSNVTGGTTGETIFVDLTEGFPLLVTFAIGEVDFFGAVIFLMGAALIFALMETGGARPAGLILPFFFGATEGAFLAADGREREEDKAEVMLKSILWDKQTRT